MRPSILTAVLRVAWIAAMLATGAATLAAGQTPARAEPSPGRPEGGSHRTAGHGVAPVATAPAAVIAYTPGVTVRSLAGRAESDVVEMAPGRGTRVGDLRRLDAVAQRLRRTETPPPAGLRAAPAHSRATRLRNADDIAAALRRPGADVLQLPSGRTLTAEQLRFVMPRAERQLGRSIAAGPVSRLSPRPAIRVDAQTDWGAVLARPDDTLIESPTGRRISVGALKRELATQNERRAPAPAIGSRP